MDLARQWPRRNTAGHVGWSQATVRSLHLVLVRWDITVVVSAGDRCTPFCIFKTSVWMLCQQEGLWTRSRNTGQEMFGEGDRDMIEERNRYKGDF